ncbi:hypothetical protein SAMN04487895_101689 [Paenibacillus sophorae]|uniref:Uncharacterized protein n=1 Tax=Paenibacillus sophorae TaxID=1333845 RepID=A0A1H8H0L6_9BACL|nr:hypothetical protein [Paenibacillus sophorae]QWU14382.1 hypothetical protein KP014_20970 [Paenibacillus sophorae]SEN49028.1 hypothetical protein SAMN04487895_101689 [Paenibacillus sophorae]
MKSMVGMTVEIETSRQHYKGCVVGHLFKSAKVDVKITEMIKGDKSVGKTARFSIGQLKSVS